MTTKFDPQTLARLDKVLTVDEILALENVLDEVEHGRRPWLASYVRQIVERLLDRDLQHETV